LILNVDGDVNVGSSGTIHMNGRGYAGGAEGQDGYSVNGQGSFGSGKIRSDGWSYSGSGGSYATLSGWGENGGDRRGEVYGSDDFWTQLYLGSGASGTPCGGNGGYGGGAIKITASNLINSGTISSDGATVGHCYGWQRGGSGGTLYFNVSGAFSNYGTVSVRGGAQGYNSVGGLGRIGVEDSTNFENLGNIYPAITCDGAGSEPDCLN
jgi:hypothetical protein